MLNIGELVMANPLFVAEVSSNHNGDLDRCLAFVHVAQQIGCDAVKFQLFRIDKLFSHAALQAKPELAKRRAWELPLNYVPLIRQECDKVGIQFGCTPFDLGSAQFLAPYVDFYKIASYNLLDWSLLRTCANLNHRLVIATGMGTNEEIADALNVVRRYKNDITLLHCVSSYPTKPADCNLAYIHNLSNQHGIKVGWSDHSRAPSVIYLASILYEAKMIEFHLDLDGVGAEYAQGHCWLPQEIQPVIAGCQQGRLIGGSGRKDDFNAEEKLERLWRADPRDGLRPLMVMREELINAQN
jgi:sialic acid synthase SpsE